MQTVVCVLRSGGEYTADWVRKLQRNVDRFSTNHRFVCLTDVEIDGVDTVPLLHDWPGWWAKMELFRPGLFDQGVTLYLDLDTVVVDNIDHLWAYQGFAALRDFYRPDKPAGGAMLWTEPPTAIYETMVNNPPPMRSRSDFFWPEHCEHIDYLQDVFPKTFGSYKADKLHDGPRSHAVVCFHGSPKQPDVADSWVGNYWI